MAHADIEAGNILNACHTILASTLEAWAQVGFDLENDQNFEMPDGLYSGQQQKLIKAAFEDVKGFKSEFETQAETIKLLSSE